MRKLVSGPKKDHQVGDVLSVEYSGKRVDLQLARGLDVTPVQAVAMANKQPNFACSSSVTPIYARDANTNQRVDMMLGCREQGTWHLVIFHEQSAVPESGRRLKRK